MKEKYNPEISARISMNDYKKEEWLLNLPLYIIEEIRNIVKKEKMIKDNLNMEKEYGYSPPFEITNEIIELVAQINELTGMIIVSEKLSSNPVLRRENRIKTIYSSLAVEQNTLTFEQVTDVINGKKF